MATKLTLSTEYVTSVRALPISYAWLHKKWSFTTSEGKVWIRCYVGGMGREIVVLIYPMIKWLRM